MWALHQLKASQDGRHERQSPSGSSSPFTESELQQFPVLSRRNFWCIQRHQATAHHYDLRLHLNGGLLSWAIPKGLLGMSKDAEPARLAIQTEIHPVSYAIHEVSRTGKPRGTLLWDVGYYFVDDIHTYDAESPESPSTDGTDAKDPGLFEERKLESAMGRIRDGQATSFHFFLRGGAKVIEHDRGPDLLLTISDDRPRYEWSREPRAICPDSMQLSFSFARRTVEVNPDKANRVGCFVSQKEYTDTLGM
ncbi:hypothetical protein Q8F55_008826 [Vanrija albida]|uniref:DNA ligase D 3'-phosphoesterase domain-containing protein n=1 Tax=Vanrija albida TaxID=181172 RepID=A0ABR3PRX2_9TREE